MSQEHASVSMENLFEAFDRTWPNISNVINSYIFPEGIDPSLLVQRIATKSESPEKQMFCMLLNCFEYQFGVLNEKILSQEGEISELDSRLTRARSQINDLHNTVSLNKRQIENLEESAKNNMFLVQDCLKDINDLNSKIFALNTQHSLENERVAQLNEKIFRLQEENSLLFSRATRAENTLGENKNTVTSQKPRRSRSDPEKFNAGQQSTEKRQMDDFHRISFVTSLLSGKAWDAVQDGVKRMNNNPLNPDSWFWKTPALLWQILDNRYILLDSTQSAKNELDTIFQDKRPYGDFKADFDHYAAKALTL
ncbi:hypothetical protein EPUL_004014 [Erysiphe pulchra]|uniref:Uncharacterized protein n=1 Tax=Erysiphe pulchra TaxID=225359 RepID=A0A2S4PMU2_9PEZI|nr:hypothetical protein EPUL_004014 [Erysiphe pulchra]